MTLHCMALIEPRNVFAWTRHDVSYPPYVSLNRDGTGFELTVRSGAEGGSMCASVHLDRDTVLALSRAIERGLT